MGCFRFGCIYRIHAPKVSALHGHGACSCTVVYLGGSYASGALSAFVRVSRHKTLCVYHLSHCFLLVFVFCLINIFFKFKFKFQVQGHNELSKLHQCWIKEMHLKKPPAKCLPFCSGLKDWILNTLRPRQNDRHFGDVFFKCIFLNENL